MQNLYLLLLYLVKEQNEKLCRMALEENPMALCFVRNQTEENCRMALERNEMSNKM